MLHKREKEREPHEEISTREGASGSCYGITDKIDHIRERYGR